MVKHFSKDGQFATTESVVQHDVFLVAQSREPLSFPTTPPYTLAISASDNEEIIFFFKPNFFIFNNFSEFNNVTFTKKNN
jgi:hypothetical protein